MFTPTYHDRGPQGRGNPYTGLPYNENTSQVIPSALLRGFALSVIDAYTKHTGLAFGLYQQETRDVNTIQLGIRPGYRLQVAMYTPERIEALKRAQVTDFFANTRPF